MTLSDRLRPFTKDRPYLVALATLNAIFGIAALVILVPLTFGGDVDIFRRGAEGIADGVIAQDFFYAPLAARLATPLTWVPFAVAALAMSLLGLGVLLAGVGLETKGMAAVDRVLVAIAALGFVPVVYELVVGQVTMLIAATVYPVRDRDGWLRGIPLGIVLGLVPKPLLIPLLAWMLVRRRRALSSAVVTALVILGLGVLVLGPELYLAWPDALTGAGQVSRPGNLAISSIEVPGLVSVLGVATVIVAGWAIVRDERRGFAAALVAGLLLAPYTQMYALSILLLAVRPALASVPRATRLLAFIANPAVLVAFLAWAAAALLAVLPLRAKTRRPPSAVD